LKSKQIFRTQLNRRVACCAAQAINNPKGRIPGSSSDLSSGSGSTKSGSSSGSEGLRRGTKPGEGAVREVAAYVLDHGHFSGVPPTALVSAYVSDDSGSGTGGAVKVGSLQQFVESEGDCEERGEYAALAWQLGKGLQQPCVSVAAQSVGFFVFSCSACIPGCCNTQPADMCLQKMLGHFTFPCVKT
jgi:hypothetical protein